MEKQRYGKRVSDRRGRRREREKEKTVETSVCSRRPFLSRDTF